MEDILYHRIFYPDETKEIRLYGLGNDDVFKINGYSGKGIRIRIIGGKGDDEIYDNSKVRGIAKKTLVYDRKKDTEIEKSRETKIYLSKSKEVNHYERDSYQLNMALPVLYFGYNKDDGVFSGAGMILKNHAWRKKPYASRHKIKFDKAFKTGAYNFEYEGVFISVFRNKDLLLNLTMNAPKYVMNFFGYGNDTLDQISDENYY